MHVHVHVSNNNAFQFWVSTRKKLGNDDDGEMSGHTLDAGDVRGGPHAEEHVSSSQKRPRISRLASSEGRASIAKMGRQSQS
jgi:hypothetical protein